MIQSAEDLMRENDRERLNYQQPISPSDIAIMPSPLMTPRPPSLPLSQRQLHQRRRAARDPSFASRTARSHRAARMSSSARVGPPSRERSSNRRSAIAKNFHKLTPEQKKKMIVKKKVKQNLKIIKNLEKLPMSVSEKQPLIEKYKEENKKLMLGMKGGNKMKKLKTKKLTSKKSKKSKSKKSKSKKSKKTKTKTEKK